jgi:predicted alpha/beta hydrolase
MEKIELVTDDGVRLVGTRFIPDGTTKAVVVLPAAMGVKQDFYFPGKRVRKVGDLPKGVVFQWAQWCKNPHYVVDGNGNPIREGFEKMRIPMLSLSFTDDELMSRRSIDSLLGFYKNARQDRRYIAPPDVGASRIGHFGFFRPQFKATLWQQALAWLEARTGTEGATQHVSHSAV